MRKPAWESNDLVLLSVSMLAQPAKKATLLAAKMRIKLELVTFVFMVCCVLTAFDSCVESVSSAGVNNLFRLSRKCNHRVRIAISAIAIGCGGLSDSGTLAASVASALAGTIILSKRKKAATA